MKKLLKKSNKILQKSGFTLVELLVVMAILGILIAVAIAGISIAQRSARDNTRVRDLTSLKGALEDCYGYSSTRTYPASITTTTVCTSTVSLQQAGGAINGTAVTAANKATCASASTATNTAWAIGYGQASSGAGYYLCTKLENGQIYDLSTQ